MLDEMTDEEIIIMKEGVAAVWREGYKTGFSRGVEWANQDRKLTVPMMIMVALMGGSMTMFGYEFFMYVMK